VAEQADGIVAATLLHRFRRDGDVSAGYRGAGAIRWLLCKVDAEDRGCEAACRAPHSTRWRGATSTSSGRVGLAKSAVEKERLTEPPSRWGVPDQLLAPGTLGLLGARFTLSVGGEELGFIEVCETPAEMARSSVAARWADTGNLILREGTDPAEAIPVLLSAAADWLLLGGVTRLVDYWAENVDSPSDLARLEQAGFHVLVRNERGFTRAM
jgi:hypothetical protein